MSDYALAFLRDQESSLDDDDDDGRNGNDDTATSSAARKSMEKSSKAQEKTATKAQPTYKEVCVTISRPGPSNPTLIRSCAT